MATEAVGTYEIINELGLHARAAAQMVKVANRFKSDVLIEAQGQRANAKSIMGVLMLAAAQGVQVKLTCKGDDAEACLQELAKLIADRFGESK
ncbi:HPr family phosphocarrier protein [Myxococcus sp. CA051A]|uniref:HPr family phosphocarrier protein n=1 Tax=Myxococcus llanfairpwllgwyngyllgogerychwyrndrobwllllantysiliogogogochensis TaxID=2590453 RepID=A0A540WQ48_9BACT|nr:MULTISPECIES: HPr family phosphocarrier protein [Myxococcus]NTX03240.1 HPr family phosphocarrier protein [Myxococcus sp. CA040A]NTX11653.1 HPr family phosphocarrier protein [Myxococcus sp. CA056]NTX34250.1 HPr family phosphocarrier protein [Myxococcus sp. CA033]NTX56194.1 HPr family phosphocarrier protein [Myxococcus sp. CA039A]NTX60920.1 HPr family phosphocarrier protein [Myxococcus sp. CA051A]